MKNIDIFERDTGISKEQIKKYILLYKKSIYKDISLYNFFLFVRMNDEYTNRLDDYCFFYDEEKDLLICMKCTTKAGHYWIQNPVTYGGITGTAVLKEGIYYKTHKVVGTYRFGIYDLELIQSRPVFIYRDGNRDNKINRVRQQYGYFGINIHTSGWTTIIDRWSAGCIAIFKPEWDWFKNRYLKLGEWFSFELITLDKLKEVI